MTQDQAVTTTPVDLVDSLGLTRGKNYYIENVEARSSVQIAELAASPSASDSGHQLYSRESPKPSTITISVESDGWWVWCKRESETANLKVTESR